MVTATHRRDNTMATVLTAIVGVFIVCHTPKAALNLYEVGTVGSNLNCLEILIWCNESNIIRLLQKLIPGLAELTSNKRLRMAEHVIANVSHILIVTNSAVNIIVYAMKVWIRCKIVQGTYLLFIVFSGFQVSPRSMVLVLRNSCSQ